MALSQAKDTNQALASGETLRFFACLIADDWHVRALGSLDETVRTGEQATNRIYGMPVFAYFEKDRKSAENFNRAMTSFSTVEAPTIAKSYDFSGIRSLTDIGGGHGLFLATILERYPDMTGTLFELPQVVNSLADGPLERFKNRVRVLAGDMFRSVPAGADAYIMKRIVHDWSDEQCGKILSSCRAGVANGGKLLVVDTPDGRWEQTPMSDVLRSDATDDAARLSGEAIVLCRGTKTWRASSDGAALRRASDGLWRVRDDRDRLLRFLRLGSGFFQDLDLAVDTQNFRHLGLELGVAAFQIVAHLVRLDFLLTEKLAHCDGRYDPI